MFCGQRAGVGQAQFALRKSHLYRQEIGADIGELRIELKPGKRQLANRGAAREERAVIGTDNAVANGERDAAGGVRLAKPQLAGTPRAIPVHPEPVEIQLDTALGQARLQVPLGKVRQSGLIQVERRAGESEQQHNKHPQQPAPLANTSL